MSTQAAVWTTFLGLASIIVASALVFVLASTKGTPPAPEVSLAIISGAALVIERLLEGGWAFVDLTAGSFWPLNAVAKKVDDRVASFGDFAKPYFGGLRAVAHLAFAADEELAPKLQKAIQNIDDAESALMHHIVPSGSRDQKLGSLISEARTQVSGVLTAHPELQKHLGADVDLAGQLVKDAKSFLDDFGDNPGRRLVSLCAGVLLGLFISGVVGLDIFSASLGEGGVHRIAIPATGIVMGLGSNPTHEVISAIQKYKQAKAG